MSLRFLRASLIHAWLEACVLGLLLMTGLVLIQPSLTQEDRQNSFAFVIFTAVLLYALRLKPPGRSWRRELFFEIVIYSTLALALSGALFILGLWMQGGLSFFSDEPGLLAMVFLVLRASEIPSADVVQLGQAITIASGIGYAFSRVGIRLWSFWGRMRRRHLIWALTHSHLLLVVLGTVLLAVLLTLNTIAYILPDLPTVTPVSVLLNLAPLVLVMIVLSTGLLLVVLPPSAILSYFVARRTTRRLKALTTAASALRGGNYAVRVDVVGEDEVARLQADFNAMAAELERAMHDLQAERDAVTTVLKSRRELVASVSHELRTPVAILRGIMEAMLTRWETGLPDTLRHDIEVMEQETVHLQRLIDDLFTLSRAEVGSLDLRRQPTDVRDVIRRSIDAAAPLLWTTGRVDVIADVPDSLPVALADAGRLEQILHNLLRNAVRHTPPGGIVIVTAHAEPDEVVIEVKDTGEGIAPDDLPLIWERFYRSTNARAYDSSGAGLGLALVKELTEAMGGSVTAASVVAQGSCFTIRLPRDKES